MPPEKRTTSTPLKVAPSTSTTVSVSGSMTPQVKGQTNHHQNLKSPSGLPMMAINPLVSASAFSDTEMGKPEVFECGICDETFSSYDKRMQHSETVHKGTRFDCKYCKYSFSALTNLYTHMIIHTEDAVNKPFKCELCNSGFSESKKLRKHCIIVHEGRPSKKKKRKMESENNGESENFIFSGAEAESDPFPKFQCIHCPESFDSADDLVTHTTNAHHAPKSKPEEPVVFTVSAPSVIFNPFCMYINKLQNPEAQPTDSDYTVYSEL